MSKFDSTYDPKMMKIYEDMMDKNLFFYRYEEAGQKKQKSFDTLMDAIKFSLLHVDEVPNIKNPLVTNAAGIPKFAPRIKL